ncbi:uncharacterized protein TOT_040000201 [Theileria orientalis strain Shintoku]|uniref:RRM domain-containing protein n=1 Tax=Theileria orientalis strain Shintoku TaxID=869250 RepID=J4C4A0_THEOR|nr:uncharacterized protein TOT_040000201 [Theileria orientalis strain Shintoku]PVC51990.1 hypothetical protein MACL_00001090 [Theileria orientalis]BAM41821.1 uncharacterized protein TOT_040000201 [Theileria orientalis strain Shintoku]|eukprot:XP_009692122.1 uncharacterized protein TOT_040000201 [Theileria orientalis strain Shintoku]
MEESNSHDNSKVYVYPLTTNITEDHVKEIFGHFGKVVNVEFHSYEKENSKRYGIVDFETNDDARNSVAHMNEGEIDGLKIKVGFKSP